MLLYAQLLLIVLLLATLVVVRFNEAKEAKERTPHATVDEIWLSKERRKTVRIETALDLTYRSEKKRSSQKAYTENISTGGLKMHVAEKLPKGATIHAEISMPNSNDPILARGIIAWSEDSPGKMVDGRRVFAVGVKFIHLKPLERRRLSSFIENSLPSA
jgi:c-di-GMP-binding flagellar brake protein YcgR